MDVSQSSCHTQQKLFRKIPPRELVENILRSCGLLGMNDLRWFTNEELILGSSDEWLPVLEPYYLPCKAQRFFHTGTAFTGARLITLFRHILGPHGYELSVVERMYKNHKKSLYQIQPKHGFKDLSGANTTIEFI